MPQWSQENILQIAPDPASAKAGKDLATARKWASFNAGPTTIWGLCQGSGSKPYQTIVDLIEPAFKCSCPSRKFPCKHGLGLLLMYAADHTAFAAADPPDWVNEWTSSRAQRAAKKAEAASTPPEPIDEVAQAKRREKRMSRILDGLASLRVWVDDVVRQGVATVPSRGYAFFDEPARRLIDAQAPGAARMVRDLSATAASGANWHWRFLRQLSSLHLLLRAAENLQTLPAETRDDVMGAIGIPVPQEEVLTQPGISDTWQVVAQEVELEEKLRVQRTWLFGINTRRCALLLHFAHGAGTLDAGFPLGSEFTGDVCGFPGNGVRAAVKNRQPGMTIKVMNGYDGLDAACDAYSLLMSRQPWLGSVVLPVRGVIPMRDSEGWVLLDTTGQRLTAAMSPEIAWRMIAVSGGHPVDCAIRMDGQTIVPVTVLSEGRFISLTASHIGEV
jgi:hypothetical protein